MRRYESLIARLEKVFEAFFCLVDEEERERRKGEKRGGGERGESGTPPTAIRKRQGKERGRRREKGKR